MKKKHNQKIQYKSFSFRLNDKTKEALKALTKEKNLSYNLLLWEMIKNYKKNDNKIKE